MSSSNRIEEIADDPDDFELPSLPAPAPKPTYRAVAPQRAHDAEAIKKWTILYPIYLDAKKPKKTGQRRVNKENAVEWPLAREMAYAAAQLGFQVNLETNKRHPADWENPGRVRVLLKNGKGKSINLRIPNRSVLLKQIAQMHPKTPSSADISQRLPQNSPAISHGILQNAVDDPQALAIPGMEGLTAPKPAVPAIEEKDKVTTAGKEAIAAAQKKGKGKQKVKVIRR